MKVLQRFKIGVFGSASNEINKELKFHAETLGSAIVARDGILCTGACEGLPHAAVLVADSVGGIIWGFSPASSLFEHINIYGFPQYPYNLIFTGMGSKGRNLICTRTCDAGIFISGGWGTLNEFTIMSSQKRVIGLLEGSGGVVDDIILPAVRKGTPLYKADIISSKDPVVLVDKIFEKLRTLHV